MTKSKSSKPTPKASATTETKKDKFIALLRREGGAPISELSEALSWLPHTTRAMLTGLRKQGFTIDKVKGEGGTRYSISAEPAA
jgi:DNA-binding IclR family transcriptional regulator